MNRQSSADWLPLAILAMASPVFADGGAVRLIENFDDLQMSVFTSPTPLRVGSVDVSVLVQDERGSAVPQADVEVLARRPGDRAVSIRAPATSAAATNKLLKAAKFEMPTAGTWSFDVAVTLPDRPTHHATFEVAVAEKAPHWQALWPWFTWPVVVIAAYLLRRRFRG